LKDCCSEHKNCFYFNKESNIQVNLLELTEELEQEFRKSITFDKEYNF